MAKLGAMQFDIPFPLYYTCSVTVLKRWCITVVYKEMSCLAIHDISGVGKYSLTVALPVLSCCGVETSVMPTAVLSTHTGGFTGFTYRDLTDDLLPMAKHWKQVGCHFQSLYSGFLGSAGQIGLVEEIFDWFREKDTMIMVDPVMGDGGKLYQTYTQEMADGMGRLCRKADIVVPNMTEACHLLEREYDPGPYTREQVEEILHELCKLGPKMAVLTGVWLKAGSLGTACYVKGASDILEAVQQRLGIKPGSITPDGKFSLDACRCIGACGLAPVMMINNDVYGRLTVDQVGSILDKYE